MKSTPVRRTRKKAKSSARTFFHQSGGPQPSFFAPAEIAVQTKCEACASQEKSIQRKEAGGGSPAAPAMAAAGFIQSLPGHGEPLSAPVQSFFESRMGTDLGSVRIHRDGEAAQSAAALHAQAYTVGENIVFNRNKYLPGTEEGRQLLSHELVHVQQQRRGEHLVQMMPEPSAPATDEKKQTANNAAAPVENKKDAPTAAAAPSAAKDLEKAANEECEKLSQPIPIADFATFGKPTVHTDFGKSVTFNGKTDATFDGGVGQTKNLKGVPAQDCSGCDPSECVHVTGTLQINYHVSTEVTLPDVPSGLTPCQEKRVSDAINNKIKPHEDQHVKAFGSYNGSVSLPINYTGCKSGLADHVQAMHEADATARESAARAQSAALDPFNVSVNLDCEDEPPKK